MITDTDVIEFQELYEKQFSVAIDRNEAYKKLTLMVRQMEIIYQPITTSQYEAYMNEYGVSHGETKQESRQDTNRD